MAGSNILVGGITTLESLRFAAGIDPGFDGERVLVASAEPESVGRDLRDSRRFWERARDHAVAAAWMPAHAATRKAPATLLR